MTIKKKYKKAYRPRDTYTHENIFNNSGTTYWYYGTYSLFPSLSKSED